MAGYFVRWKVWKPSVFRVGLLRAGDATNPRGSQSLSNPTGWVILGEYWVPTVFRINGFVFRILPPPREHEPPHVHVLKAGATVIINLPGAGSPGVRKVKNMRESDVAIAMRLVDEHADRLLAAWELLHG